MRRILSVAALLCAAGAALAQVAPNPGMHHADYPIDPGIDGSSLENGSGDRFRFSAAAADTYCIVWYSFETKSWQGWARFSGRDALPPRSRLLGNLVDEDPCGDNLGTQIVFFLEEDPPSADYPGLRVTPFCDGPGGTSDPCQDELVISPPIDVNRYSTACNAIQDASVPVSSLPQLGSCELRFTVYRDLPYRNNVFYRWRVRTVENGAPGPWLERNMVYYGPGRDYCEAREVVSDLVAADTIQIGLGVVDMCGAWYGSYVRCEDHTPSPWIDNVRLYRYAGSGPQWSCRRLDLFQDNFPGDETNVESFVRADAAMDINTLDNPEIRPGDSAVVWCAAPLAGGLAADGGWPAVYMHARTRYVGSQPAKPALYGPQMAGDLGRYKSDDGAGWTVIQGDTARTAAGTAPGRYMFDLNDELLTRGYVVDYYFSARDLLGAVSYLPQRAPERQLYFEFTCLPSLRSDVLFVDACDGIGTFLGVVEDYWMPTFMAVLPVPNNVPDKYDVNAPVSRASNGPASRAKLAQFTAAYRIIVWDSGNLETFAIGDGTNEKCDDCRLLLDWMDAIGHDCGLWILGDGVAEDLADIGSSSALALLDFCGIEDVHGSYFEMTGGYGGGGITSPLVSGDEDVPLFSHGGEVDQFYAYGGCYEINAFDVLEPRLGAARVLRYPDFNGEACGAAVATCQNNAAAFEAKTVVFGFSLQYLRGPNGYNTPYVRNHIANDVLDFMQNMAGESCDAIARAGLPKAHRLEQNFPNPFNPGTTIRYLLKRETNVNIAIYSVDGRLVKRLVNGTRPAGVHEIPWDGTDDSGAAVKSGIYFCRIQTAGFMEARKLVLVR